MLAKISTGVIALNGRDMADDPKLLAAVSSEKQAEIFSILWLILTGKGSGQKKSGPSVEDSRGRFPTRVV